MKDHTISTSLLIFVKHFFFIFFFFFGERGGNGVFITIDPVVVEKVEAVQVVGLKLVPFEYPLLSAIGSLELERRLVRDR